MYLPSLKFDHNLGEALDRNFVLPFYNPILTYLMILAIYTTEITITEEDISDAVRTADCGLNHKRALLQRSL